MRRWTGLALLGLCLVLPAFWIASGPLGYNLRLEPALSVTWELPGPLPWLVPLLYPASILLLWPDFRALSRRRPRLAVAVAVCGGMLLGLAGLVTAGIVGDRILLDFDRRIVHLPDPGVFGRAVVDAHGRQELAADLWVVRRGGRGFEAVGESDYPPCDWPFEVRKSPAGPRYLFVDSRLRASALLDLSSEPPNWRDLPPLEEIRREFGEDVLAVVDF